MARFANVSAVSGIDFPEDGRALCLVDWDHDGDLDDSPQNNLKGDDHQALSPRTELRV